MCAISFFAEFAQKCSTVKPNMENDKIFTLKEKN